MSKSRFVEAASKHPIRKRPAKVSRVPSHTLDHAVRVVKANRTYALESFTQADWDEVRIWLPLEYRWLSNDQLTRQACNRRKVGAYTTTAKRDATARWSEVKKLVRLYWSGDASLDELGQSLDGLSGTATAKPSRVSSRFTTEGLPR